jgi:mannose-6-phosphate isomerase-like protein (cupin superfamily)
MTYIPAETAPRFDLPGIQFTGLASPSRGSHENSVWRLRIDPGTLGEPHQLDREEIFVAVAGRATATVDDVDVCLVAGDALIVDAGQPFSLTNTGAEPFEAVAVLPVGGQATMPGREPFMPPWTE